MSTNENLPNAVQAQAGRRDFRAKRVASPAGSDLWRVSWTERKTMRGGYGQDVERVQWYAWAAGEYLGANETRRSALDIITYYLSLTEES